MSFFRLSLNKKISLSLKENQNPESVMFAIGILCLLRPFLLILVFDHIIIY